MVNMNTKEYLEKMKVRIFEILRQLPPAPSVQMHHVPSPVTEQKAVEDDPDKRPRALVNGRTPYTTDVEDMAGELSKSGNRMEWIPNVEISNPMDELNDGCGHEHAKPTTSIMSPIDRVVTAQQNVRADIAT
jgi:hypothetical protein